MLASILESDAAWALGDLPRPASAVLKSRTSTPGADGSWGSTYTTLATVSVSLVKEAAIDTAVEQTDLQVAEWSCVCPYYSGMDVGGKVLVGGEEFEVISMTTDEAKVYMALKLGKQSKRPR